MHTLTRSLTVATVASLSVLVVGVGTASAHVRVSSADAAPGGYGELTFRVPTESDTLSTVALSVKLPTDTPIASVSVKPVPGWTATADAAPLDQPVQTDDGELTEAVSQVTWTADAGQGIAPGQYQTFTILAGPLPDTDELALPAVQTYSDGSEVAWIDPTVDGQGEPEHPAPVLQLTAGAGSDSGVAATSDTDTTATSGAAEDADEGTSGTAVAGLVIAIVALVAALGALVTGLSSRKRRSDAAA